MKGSAMHSLFPTFGFAPVDERFQITVGNVSTIPQITLLSSLDWKAAKNGTKKGKTWGEKGRRNDDKRGTKGVRGEQKMGNDDKGGWNVAAAVIVASSRPFVFPFLTSSSSSPEKITRFLKGGFRFLLFFPTGQILVGGLNQSESCQSRLAAGHTHIQFLPLYVWPRLFFTKSFLLFLLCCLTALVGGQYLP